MKSFQSIIKEFQFYSNWAGDSTSFADALNIYLAEIKEDVEYETQDEYEKFKTWSMYQRGWAQQLDLNRRTHGWTVNTFLERTHQELTQQH